MSPVTLPADPARPLIREYAEAGISEYWIVDPEERRIVVLTLQGDIYREAGVYGPGETAASVLLPGLAVAVDAVWESGADHDA